MEADLLTHGASKCGQKPGLELQLADDEAKDYGTPVHLSPDEIDTMNFKILAAIGDRQMTFCLPEEQPIELLFFRRIFTRLRQQIKDANEVSGRSSQVDKCKLAVLDRDTEDENIPIQAFQRAMGRLFYVLRDPEPFDSRVYDQNGNNYVGWGEFCYVWKDRKITVRLSRCERIYLTFDDPQSSYLARIVSVVTLLTIVISSVGFILSTVPELQDNPSDGSAPKPGPVFDYIENGCLIIFVLEYLIRLCTCWAMRDEVFDKALLLEMATGYERIQLSSPVVRICRFVVNGQNLIDLAAILPGVVTALSDGAGGGGFVVLRLIRLTRIFRAFRLGKYVEPVVVITRTVKQSTKALYVLAFNLLLGVVIFGSLMYLMEQGEWDEELHEYTRVEDYTWNATLGDYEKVRGITPFKSIPHAFWWALVTSTTVGYGDHYPTTLNGYIVAVLCMVWSLVILALPVGVIGGTFTKVWDDFNKNKKIEAEDTRREMVYVAHAIQRIQPAEVSRLLLLQVWNDDGQFNSMPVSPEDFMGEVKLELDLPANTEIKGKEMRLQLQSNPQIVKRDITGFLTVRYDWFPTEPGTDLDRTEEAHDGSSGSSAGTTYSSSEFKKLLHGTLRLQIIRADDLINTDWGHHYCSSSPYVLALCYPTSPAPEAHLHPVVWRLGCTSPSAQHTLNPIWQCEKTFNYLWYVPIDTIDRVEYRTRACNKVSSDKVTRFSDTGSSSATKSSSLSLFPDSPGPGSQDEVTSMLLKLTGSMPQLMSGLDQIQKQVANLSTRVDNLSASLRDRSGGNEGPGRPGSDLRGTARSDSGSSHSIQPGPQHILGREREPKGMLNRTELNGGSTAGRQEALVVEDPLEDSLEEVNMLMNGGPRAIPVDIMADAGSLHPHAIPPNR